MDIQKIFDKVSNREIAYTYLIKKVAETPLKSDRIKIASSLIEFLQKEQDEYLKSRDAAADAKISKLQANYDMTA